MSTSPYYEDERFTIYHADCTNLLGTLPSDSIDAILTDPPYPKEFMYLYESIAVDAKRILKSHGSYVAIVPHYSLPTILEQVGRHLKYRWTMCMWQQENQHPRMAMGIEVLWKPLVWWVKDSWKQGRGFVADGFENKRIEKSLHEWQQAIAWAEYCMKFTRDGEVVCDPLMGSGTMGVQCVLSGRKFIGVDKDEQNCENTVKRILEATGVHA